MFGYVTANIKELDKKAQQRYAQVYCGICREIRCQSGNLCRIGLSYDMAFLALLHMSLYEPQEQLHHRRCMLHPLRKGVYTENEFISYCADMNVALAYYKAVDDYRDEHNLSAKLAGNIFGSPVERIRQKYPRQCETMEAQIRALRQLELENCSNPDEPATCFGKLMAELMVYREDLWADSLRQMGMALGRYIYLADAAVDYPKDQKKGSYNPFIAMNSEYDPARFEEYLVLEMARCTRYFEKLPLVQDKDILDNILYSGIWLSYRQQQRGAKKQ